MLSSNSRKSTILAIFVILKLRDWDAGNFRIRDWRKRPGSRDPAIWDPEIAATYYRLPNCLSICLACLL